MKDEGIGGIILLSFLVLTGVGIVIYVFLKLFHCEEPKTEEEAAERAAEEQARELKRQENKARRKRRWEHFRNKHFGE